MSRTIELQKELEEHTYKEEIELSGLMAQCGCYQCFGNQRELRGRLETKKEVQKIIDSGIEFYDDDPYNQYTKEVELLNTLKKKIEGL